MSEFARSNRHECRAAKDRAVLGALAGFVAAFTAIAIPAHATYGARIAVDEPQYLLTAMSLAEDRSLDLSDELAREAYRPFHRVDLPRQTHPAGASGREVSPHDPLLPVLLAMPMHLGGWVAAKATLAVAAGALAALTAWTAMRRFAVRRRVAVGVTAAFACTAPLATYATQVYPEIVAALAVVASVAAMTAKPGRRPAVALVLALVALPWLSVKYAPVAASLAAVAAWRWRGDRRLVAATLVGLAVTAGVYLVAHRHLYGGWTAYASSAAAASIGELSVIGTEPDYLGRSRRIVGLLVDDGFGLALWMPAWLALPFAIGSLLRRRPPGVEALIVPLGTGWLVATFVALTMHGWWWPGRQVVVVLPLAVIAIASAAAAITALRRALAAAAAIGVVTWLWTTIEAITRRHVLVVDFEHTGNVWIQLLRRALPDGRSPTVTDSVLLFAWTVAIAVFGWAGWSGSANGPDWRQRVR